MAKIRTHYDNLGVARNADPAVIKAAHKALAQKYHPDRNPNNPDAERIMKIINTAYQVLSDPARRAEHDRWIDEQEKEQEYQTFNNSKYNKNHHSSQEKSKNYTTSQNKNTNSRYQDNSSSRNARNRKKSKSNPKGDKNKGSWIGNILIPLITTIFASKILLGIEVFLGMFSFVTYWLFYDIAYVYTYDNIKSNKYVKEILASIAGILYGFFLVFILIFLAYIFNNF